MMQEQGKSPNRLWKESGTSLSFAEWIQREKDKGVFLPNKKFENFSNADGATTSPEEFIKDSITKAKVELGIEQPKNLNRKDNTVLGLNKTVLIVSAAIILGAIAYKIYQNRK